jgi:uncharacterized protein (DUF4415 family)
MNVKSRNTRRAWQDPDDAPELTDDFFEHGNLYVGARLIKRGRPRAEVRKVSTTLRLSPEVLQHFRASGPGWQTRIDEALRRVVARSGARTVPAKKASAANRSR